MLYFFNSDTLSLNILVIPRQVIVSKNNYQNIFFKRTKKRREKNLVQVKKHFTYIIYTYIHSKLLKQNN